MDSQDFAREFGELYRELYQRAVRRVTDGRELLSAETLALLLHLAQAGPQTLSELTLHLDRAPSTLSAKMAELEAQGLLTRQRDMDDARRSLIWMTPAGRDTLLKSLEVLDSAVLAAAAEHLDTAQRTQLLDGLRALLAGLAHNPRRNP